MPTVKIVLPETAHDVLIRLAKEEMRDPRAQAVMLIRQALEQHANLARAGKALE